MKKGLVIIMMLSAPVLTVGCAGVGPSSISNGRMAYNEVINYTEDQQLLNAIVCERYGQTFGMLSVSSVAANVKFRGSVGAQLRAWGSAEFTDALVPLSLGAAYEENPTISYVPVQGEAVLRSLVTPFSIEEGFLLVSAAKERHIVERLLYRRFNDQKVPIDAPLPPELLRSGILYNMLREAGIARIGHVPDSDDKRPKYVFIFSGYSEKHYDTIREYFALIGVRGQVIDGRTIALPFGQSVDLDEEDTIYVETRSVLDWLRLAASMVEVPKSHLEAGIVEPGGWHGLPMFRLITIRSSEERPDNAVVSIPFRGWWFYIDATDSRSKESFRLIKFIVRLRINPEGIQQQVPVLTIPVG